MTVQRGGMLVPESEITISRQSLSQAGKPAGFIGWLVGKIMFWHNQPDNVFTLSNLAIATTDYILEVGFGPGRAIQLAAKRATHGFVAGVDHSAQMVSDAAKLNRSSIDSGKVHLDEGSVLDLPYENGAFDKAFSINCIYFWGDTNGALLEIHRVLKAGGQLAITVRDGSRPIYQQFNSEKLTAMFRQAGFVDVRSVHNGNPGHPLICVVGRKP